MLTGGTIWRSIKVGFLGALLSWNAVFWLMLHDYIPHRHIEVKGNHIHHFNLGIWLLVIACSVSLALLSDSEWVKRLYSWKYFSKKIAAVITSVIFGISLFLISDELDMLIKFREDGAGKLRYAGWVVLSAVFVFHSIIYRVSRFGRGKTDHKSRNEALNLDRG